jgi:uracil-DNA glycosylase family 4
MMVGQDWGCTANLTPLACDSDADIKWGTGKILHELLKIAGVPLDDCFFTNALFGVRTGSTNTGSSPGWKDPGFVQRCTDALQLQIQVVRPHAVICLGREAPRLLAQIFPQCRSWIVVGSFKAIDNSGHALVALTPPVATVRKVAILVHPCYRHANVKRRSFGGHTGNAAEMLILQSLLGTEIE